MAPRRVLVTDTAWPHTNIERQVLEAVGAELVIAQTGEEGELVDLVRNADAILTCFAQVTPAVVQAGSRLQVIGRYGIGVDNIAVEEATRRQIPVTNVPGYCSDEVAEHVLAMVLSLARGLPRYDRAVRRGNWSLQTGLPTRRLRGRTLGVIGYGRIGQAVAQRAQAFGMGVIVYAPQRRAETLMDGVEALDLMDVAARSDFVSIHLPLTDATRGMIGREFLEAMPPGSYLINAARGAIVDQNALAAALRDGGLAGAGLDVFVPECLPVDHPLLTSDRVLATPHTAFYSEESVQELARLAAENVAAIFDGRRPADTVNPNVLDGARWAHLRR